MMLPTTKYRFKKPGIFERLNLIKRIKNTHFYMKKCGYDLTTAWRRAGITL